MSKKTLTTFFIGLIIGSVSLSYAAWTAPTATPPNDNVAAPINVSSMTQDKVGVLTLGGLGVFGSALITSSAGYTLPTNLNLGVNGKIGAKQYCDERGNNCLSIMGGGGGSASTSATSNSSGTSKAWVTFRNIGGTVTKVGDSYGVQSVASAAGVTNFLAWDTIITLDQPLLSSNYAVVASPAFNAGEGRYNGTVLDWVCIWSKVSSSSIGVHCAYPGYGAYGNSIVSVVVFSM